MKGVIPELSNPVQVLTILLADPLERVIRESFGDVYRWHLLRDGRAVSPAAAAKLCHREACEFYGGRLFVIEGIDGPERNDGTAVLGWLQGGLAG